MFGRAAKKTGFSRNMIIVFTIGAAVLVLIFIIGIAFNHVTHDSPADEAAQRISTAAVGTVVNDGTTITASTCDPSTVQTWDDGSVSATCVDTFSDGTTATQPASDGT